MYWTNNQRLSFFSILFLLLYFIKEILSLRNWYELYDRRR